MVRATYHDEKGLRKGAWSKEEDDKLREYVTRYGHWNWRELPKFAGLARCGKSCRLRWMNYLRPDLKHGRFTQEEDDLIFKLYQELGTKWSMIASKMPGRTDNEIKNYWHAHLKKRSRWTGTKSNDLHKSSSSPSSSSSHPQHSHIESQGQDSEFEAMEVEGVHHALAGMTITPPILESSPFSPETSPHSADSFNDWAWSLSNNSRMVNVTTSDEATNVSYVVSPHNRYETVQNEKVCYDVNNYTSNVGGGDFWTEPFVVDDNTTTYGGTGSSFGSWDQSYSWMGGETTSLMRFDDDVESWMYEVMQQLPVESSSNSPFG